MALTGAWSGAGRMPSALPADALPTTHPHRKEITLRQNPSSSCAGVRRGATRALRVIVAGSGAVLNVTGTALVCTGRVLKVCGQKIKSFAIPNHSTPQPNA